MYTVGQKVKVKSNLTPERHYEGCYFPQELYDRWAGKIVTIKEQVPNRDGMRYYVEECDSWIFVASFFEPVTYTQDEAFQSLLDGHLSDEEYEQLIKVIK